MLSASTTARRVGCENIGRAQMRSGRQEKSSSTAHSFVISALGSSRKPLGGNGNGSLKLLLLLQHVGHEKVFECSPVPTSFRRWDIVGPRAMLSPDSY